MVQALLLLAIVALPAALAALVRRARCPGWPVVGGLLAGIVLGPSVAGRVAPEAWASVVEGAPLEREQLQDLRRRHGAELAAARHASFDDRELAAVTNRNHREADLAVAAFEGARREHQRPQRILAGLLVAAVLLGGGLVSIRANGQRAPPGTALSIGAWAAALPAGLAFYCLRWWWEQGVTESLLAAAAVAIGPWALGAVDRGAADHAEVHGALTMQSAGRCATALAIGLVLAALAHAVGIRAAAAGAVLLAAPAGWLLRPLSEPAAAVARRWIETLCVAPLAAWVAMRVDFPGSGAWLLPAALLLVLAGDARWIGAFCGAMVLGGRRGLRTLRLVMGAMAAGPTQLAVTAVALCTGHIEERFALALLLSAVVIEVLTPLRRAMAGRLDETEQEMEDLNG